MPIKLNARSLARRPRPDPARGNVGNSRLQASSCKLIGTANRHECQDRQAGCHPERSGETSRPLITGNRRRVALLVPTVAKRHQTRGSLMSGNWKLARSAWGLVSCPFPAGPIDTLPTGNWGSVPYRPHRRDTLGSGWQNSCQQGRAEAHPAFCAPSMGAGLRVKVSITEVDCTNR